MLLRVRSCGMYVCLGQSSFSVIARIAARSAGVPDRAQVSLQRIALAPRRSEEIRQRLPTGRCFWFVSLLVTGAGDSRRAVREGLWRTGCAAHELLVVRHVVGNKVQFLVARQAPVRRQPNQAFESPASSARYARNNSLRCGSLPQYQQISCETVSNSSSTATCGDGYRVCAV